MALHFILLQIHCHMVKEMYEDSSWHMAVITYNNELLEIYKISPFCIVHVMSGLLSVVGACYFKF